jgi:methyl-accepting chemotaxis protein
MPIDSTIKSFLREAEIHMATVSNVFVRFERYADEATGAMHSIAAAFQSLADAVSEVASALEGIADKLPDLEDLGDVEDLFDDSDPADEIEPSGKN